MNVQYSNEELVAAIQNGEKDRIAQLWAQVESFVKQQANRWTCYAEFEDLTQEGYLILLEVVKSYDASKGAKFITWLGNGLAWGWRRWISTNIAGVHIPAHMAERLFLYDKVCKEWKKQTGNDPTTEQLCYLMKCSRSELQAVKDTAKRVSVVSLQERIGEDEYIELQDTITDCEDFTETVLDSYQREELKAAIWPIVDTLEGMQGAVLRQRYEQGRTFDETGAALGISRERCRQIEEKALRVLRRPKNRKTLQPFYDDIQASYAMKGTGISTFTLTWTSATEREAIRNYELCQCGLNSKRQYTNAKTDAGSHAHSSGNSTAEYAGV